MHDLCFPRLAQDFAGQLKKGVFEDLTQQPRPTQEDIRMQDRALDPEEIPEQVRKRVKLTEKTPAEQTVYQKTDLESLAATRENAATKETAREVVQLVTHLDTVEDVKQFAKGPERYMKRPAVRKAIEVSLKSLEGEELAEMEEAMAKELSEWLQEEALETVKRADLPIDPERLLKMR